SECHESEDLAPKPSEPEHHQADGQPEGRRQDPPHEEGGQERPSAFHHHHADRVDADAVESALPEAEIAGEPGEQIPRRSLGGPEEDRVGEEQIEDRPAGSVHEVGVEPHRHRDHEGGGGRQPRPRLFHVADLPMIPWGRNSKVAMRTRKIARGASGGPPITVAMPPTTPTMAAAIRVPRVLPRPPRITTEKTMPNHSTARPGNSARLMATKTPAIAAK